MMPPTMEVMRPIPAAIPRMACHLQVHFPEELGYHQKWLQALIDGRKQLLIW